MTAPRSFYLAAASSNVDQAKARIADLESMGLRCTYNWTPLDKPEAEWAKVARDEVRALLVADVFVALSPVSAGVGYEICARVMSYRGPVNLVGPWVCPFAHDSRVVCHEAWADFLAALARGDA